MLAYRRKFKKYKKTQKKHSEVVRLVKNWSAYQNVVFCDFAQGEGNTVIKAGPGSGKTSTLVEGLFHIPSKYLADHRVLATAYNASIAPDKSFSV